MHLHNKNKNKIQVFKVFNSITYFIQKNKIPKKKQIENFIQLYLFSPQNQFAAQLIPENQFAFEKGSQRIQMLLWKEL